MRSAFGLAARVACLALVLASLPVVAAAERLWLVVGASDTSAARLARQAQALAPRASAGLVVQMRDCGAARQAYAWVAEVASSAEAAQAALARARTYAADAYVKRCDAVAGSLLARRIPAIDASIAAVPEDAVNWGDEDRVSELRTLGAGRSLLVTRHFDARPNDELEGRRTRLSLIGADGQARLLLEHCLIGAAPAAVSRQGDVALQCASEQAADHLLHRVHAYSAAGAEWGRFERCRNPRWAEAAQPVLSCEAESVAADGRLELRRQRQPLPSRP
ncbi:conserved exported hypothetical protein [Rubrivivax sp. A210]|uniref:hypothetical protein n=1 Tax=Rubrivivax sp. A210 TaxID=2772301 RepID=UPI001918FE2D|nr:hypothetical protein [Rubrivivax sp. A210]CAD5373250.1 conserved exported hypothetical protein [Rubrivivax sp. A210]